MSIPVKILVIDDNPGSLELIAGALRKADVEVFTSQDPLQGIEIARQIHPELVITDLVMPHLTGIEVLDQVLKEDPAVDVVLMTAHYTTESAVTAIRNGAADYLEKPVKIAVLRDRVAKLLESSRARRAAIGGHGQDNSFEGMLAQSKGMWDLFAAIQRIAPHYRSVLITGETGTGKDLVAAALHSVSGVRGKFISLNCSAVVDTLFESELFGHLRGAFTGADRDKMGLMEAANGGTLFLDEIGDMPLAAQAKLLRALQNREIRPLGALVAKKLDLRVVAATHRDLRTMIREGKFREDLYFRLGVVELDIPPLRRRIEDFPFLVKHFIHKFAAEYSRDIRGLASAALDALQKYAWPGNVRELEHVIARACMLSESNRLEVADFPAHIVKPELHRDHASTDHPPMLAEQERSLVEKAMRDANGNQSEAARRLGIGRDALRYKLKKWGIT